MPSLERVWARIAAYSYYRDRKFAILERTAWGERVTNPMMTANTVEFTGRLIHGPVPTEDDDSIVTIGFFHPIFSGAAAKGMIVEVTENLSKTAPVDYIAQGKGIQTLPAGIACPEQLPNEDPCGGASGCDEDNSWWAWGWPGESEDDPEAQTFFDADDQDIDPGPNQFPAIIELPGYTGDRTLPALGRVILGWCPGACAFMPEFQACNQNRTGDPSPGIGIPSTQTICCWLQAYFAANPPSDEEEDDGFDDLQDLMDFCKDYLSNKGGPGYGL